MLAVTLILSLAQATLPPASTARESDSLRVVRTLGASVAPERLLLNGPRARVRIPVSLPPGPIDSGAIVLRGRFAGAMLPTANVTVRVGGVRRGALIRSDADREGVVVTTIPLDAGELRGAGGTLDLLLESRLPASSDRCAEDLISTARVRIDAESRVELYVRESAAASSILDLPPGPVTISLRPGPMSAAELDSVLAASGRLAALGHPAAFTTVPGQTALALIGGSFPLGAALDAATVPRPLRGLNLTLAELGVGDLTRDFMLSAQWVIPVDQRVLPAGRLPDRLIVNLVTAPTGLDPTMRVRALLNGNFLRDVEVLGNGNVRTLRLRLPPEYLRIYNEVLLDAARETEVLSPCNHEPVTFPAQIHDASYLVTAGAPPRPRTFPSFIAVLPARFPLYVTDSAMARPETTLQLLAAAQQALWGAGMQRVAEVRRYDGALPELDGAAVALTMPEGTRTRIELTRRDGEAVLMITPAADGGWVSALPEDYGASDTVSFARGQRPFFAVRTAPPPRQMLILLGYRSAVVYTLMILLTTLFIIRARRRRPMVARR